MIGAGDFPIIRVGDRAMRKRLLLAALAVLMLVGLSGAAHADAEAAPSMHRLRFFGTPSPAVTITPAATDTLAEPTLTPMPAPVAPAGNVQDWSTFALPGVIVVIIAAVWLRRRRTEPPKPD